jgi:hypothetical protein
VLDYFKPPGPARPRLAETGDAWALRKLKNRERRAWVWKSLILLGVIGVIVLEVYMLNQPDPGPAHRPPEPERAYEMIIPR